MSCLFEYRDTCTINTFCGFVFFTGYRGKLFSVKTVILCLYIIIVQNNKSTQRDNVHICNITQR